MQAAETLSITSKARRFIHISTAGEVLKAKNFKWHPHFVPSKDLPTIFKNKQPRTCTTIGWNHEQCILSCTRLLPQPSLCQISCSIILLVLTLIYFTILTLTFNSLILGLGIVFASIYTYKIYFTTSLIKRLLKQACTMQGWGLNRKQ